MFKMKAKLKEGSSVVTVGLMFKVRNETATRTLIGYEKDRNITVYVDDHASRWTADYLDARLQAPEDDKNKFQFLGFKQKDNE